MTSSSSISDAVETATVAVDKQANGILGVEPTGRRSGYIPTLDGWRAVAIGGVLIAHGCATVFGAGGPLQNDHLYRLTRHGAYGVDIFFGISGYLICSRLLEERAARGQISLWGFYIRRACRILPPYLVYLTTIGLFAIAGMLPTTWGEWLSCALFARNYYPILDGGRGWYTDHLWSVAVEEHFYLLLPAVIAWLKPSRALMVAAAGACAVAVWRSIEFRYGLLTSALPDSTAFYARTDIRLDALLFGAVAALLTRRPHFHMLARALLSPTVTLAGCGLLVAMIAFQFPQKMLCVAIVIPLVIVGTVTHPASSAARVLELRGMRWVGRLSYSLYLWQQLFLVGDGVPRPRPFAGVQELPWSLVALFACATVSYYFIERPFVRLGHRLARPTSPGHRDL